MSAPKIKTQKIELSVALSGRDELHLALDVVNGEIAAAKLTGCGCLEFLKLMEIWRPKLKGRLNEVEIPAGQSHSEMLLREALLKAKGAWVFPYADEELCHCRAVATSKVDSAVVGGCRTVRAIARETSAGTSCGSCRLDTEAIIDFRLQAK